MKFKIEYNFSRNVSEILRKAGYKSIFDPKTGKQSFSRSLTNGRYPRFHLYLKEEGPEIIFDLHLDQSKTRYKGQTAHNADYESPEVKNELIKIYQEVKKWTADSTMNEKKDENPNKKQKPTPQIKSWFKKIFRS
ncbi:MAG: hypothetical protein R6V40_00905 [Candidatus Moraniibacteriota bacterium]